LRTAHFSCLGGDGGEESPTSSYGGNVASRGLYGGCSGVEVEGCSGVEEDASFGNHPLVVFFLGFLFLHITKGITYMSMKKT
jgi:hypothetical protein